MDKEKRIIEGYEVMAAIHIGGKEVILAENRSAQNPYMVCDCTWNSLIGAEIYDNAQVSMDYLEVTNEFLKRVGDGVQSIAERRSERGISAVSLTVSDCIKNSYQGDYLNQLVVVKPENIAPYARTADSQLLLAEGGNGCNPDARGTAVFCRNLFTGKTTRWERYDIAGIIRPDRIPPWAHEKLQNYLQAAEISTEQNYNQIDGLINNTAAPKADLTDGQTLEEIKELAPETMKKPEKSSVLRQLKEGKENDAKVDGILKKKSPQLER